MQGLLQLDIGSVKLFSESSQEGADGDALRNKSERNYDGRNNSEKLIRTGFL